MSNVSSAYVGLSPLVVALLAGVLAVVWPSASFCQSAVVVVPSGGSLALRNYNHEPEIAEFSGRVRVRGTFQLGWSMDGDTPLELELRFVPSSDGWALLPKFEGQSITREDYIRIRNVRAASKSLVGEQRFAQVASRAKPMESGEAELVLSSVVLANECGFRFEASSSSSRVLPTPKQHVATEFKPHC